MKALAVVLAVLLVLAHPLAAAVVLGLTAAACGASAWLVWRAFRMRPNPYPWRTT